MVQGQSRVLTSVAAPGDASACVQPVPDLHGSVPSHQAEGRLTWGGVAEVPR